MLLQLQKRFVSGTQLERVATNAVKQLSLLGKTHKSIFSRKEHPLDAWGGVAGGHLKNQ